MTFGSLFSGIGGFELALEQSGMTCIWQAEKDQHCSCVLAHHWPNVKRYTDVKAVTTGSTDLVCGGFPCQDLSVAGKRAGLAGDRSGLWSEFKRILASLRPRWVLIENVPGLLSSNRGRDMGTVLGQLGELGYGWAYRCLDAQFFNLAQRRQRVFIVGCLGDAARAAAVLFEPESCDGDSPPSREAGQGTTRDVAPCIRSSGQGTQRAGDSRGQDALICDGFSEAGQGWWRDGVGPIRAEGENRPSRPSSVICGALQAHQTRHGHAMGTQQAAESGQLVFGGNCQSGPRAAAAVNAGGQRRQDFETENFVVTHSLRAAGADASEDGTGRGTPLVPVTIGLGSDPLFLENMAQPVTGRNGDPGVVCFNPHRTLQKDGTVAEGFKPDSITDALHGPTGNKEPLVMHTSGHGGSNGAGIYLDGGAPTIDTTGSLAVAFAQNQRDEVRDLGDLAGAVQAEPGMKQQTYLAFQERGRKDGRNLEHQADLAYSLNNPGNGGRRHELNINHGMTVRRLTPTECLRLQGFPDDWLDGMIPPLSDSAKYRMIGNSVAVPCVAWIARRIMEANQ